MLYRKKNGLHIIVIMVIVSSLLMIAHNNAPRLLSMRYLWGPFFVLAALFLRPILFKQKLIRINIFYLILYGFILPSFLWADMNDWYAKRQLTLFVVITSCLVINQYLQRYSDANEMILYSKLSLFFIVVTCVMTIIATEIHPMVVRASYSGMREDIADFIVFRKLGIGSYGYMTALVLLFPPLIGLLRNSNKKLKFIYSMIIVIIYLTLIRAQIFANILVASLIIIFSLVGARNAVTTATTFVVIAIIALIIPQTLYSDLLMSISSFFDANSLIHNKFSDLSHYLSNANVNSVTGAEGRMERYPMLWSAFIDSPILGAASYNSVYSRSLTYGAHLFWMSRLTLWGLFAFGGFVYLLYLNFKSIYKYIYRKYRYYYLLSIIAFVALGFLKSLNFLESLVVFYIVFPALIFLDRDNKGKKL